MFRALIATVLLAFSGASLGQQALDNNPIVNSGDPANGYQYFDGLTKSADLEIRFEVDPTEFGPVEYGCDWTPWGYWLYDEFNIQTSAGNRMITMSDQGDLCVVYRPGNGGFDSEEFVGGVFTDGSENVLLLEDGQVTLNGVTRSISFAGATFQHGSNGVGVGHEVNGYHNPWSNDSFPGNITYIRDNGVDPFANGPSGLRGTATFYSAGPAQCEDGVDNDGDGFVDFPNDPGCDSASDNDETTPPPPTACEIDPTSFDCACETNNNAWAECLSCQL